MLLRSTVLPILTVVASALALTGCPSQPTVIDHSRITVTPVFRRRPPTPPPAPRPLPPTEDLSQGLPRIPGVRIVVDPGHGGKDTGAPAKFRGSLPEKNIVLMISNRLARLLRACGADVIQTRTDDTFIELEARPAISNRARADLFVSIHADAFRNGKAAGATIYIEPHAYWRTVSAARSIERAFKQAGIHCRGVEREEFRVLVKNRRPAILIETGYMTNATESQRLNSNWYRNKIAHVIARGITNHFSP